MQSCQYGQGRVSYLQVFVDLLQNSLVPGNYFFKMMSGTKICICKMSKHKRIFRMFWCVLTNPCSVSVWLLWHRMQKDLSEGNSTLNT